MKNGSLISVSADAKTVKGEKLGALTGILYLAPARMSALWNLCTNSTKGCEAACLVTAGRASFDPKINVARIRKTTEFMTERKAFVAKLDREISALERKADRENLAPAARLNGTSDLRWEGIAPALFASHPSVTFYDYTKDRAKALDYVNGKLPANYSLTYSFSERDAADPSFVRAYLAMGGNVAVVFRTADRPSSFMGAPTVNGDESDARFLDQKGVVVALKAKGRAKGDRSGFVVDITD